MKTIWDVVYNSDHGSASIEIKTITRYTYKRKKKF